MEIRYFSKVEREFVAVFDKATNEKFARLLSMLTLIGNKVGMPHSRALGSGLHELRIRGTREVRMIYIFDKDFLRILHCFYKKTQKTSKQDLEIARKRKALFECS